MAHSVSKGVLTHFSITRFFRRLAAASLFAALFATFASADTVYFPQAVAGDGYSTTFTIINTEAIPLMGRLRVFNQDGSAVATPLQWENVSIAPAGSTRLTLSNPGKLAVVSASFEASGRVGGVASLERRSVSGNLESLVDLQATVASPRFVLPVEVSSSDSTGIAIMNAGTDSTNIRLQLVGENGAVISTQTDPRLNPFGAHAQIATFLLDLFPQIPLSNFKGTLIIEATGSALQIAATGIAFKEGLLAGLSAIASAEPSANSIIIGFAGTPFFSAAFQSKRILAPANYAFSLAPGVYQVSGDVTGTLIIALAGASSPTVTAPAVVAGSLKNLDGPNLEVSPCFILYSSPTGTQSFSFQFTVSADTTNACGNGVANNPLIDSNEAASTGDFESFVPTRNFDVRSATFGGRSVVVAGTSRTMGEQQFIVRAYDIDSGQLQWTDQTLAFDGITTNVFSTTVGETLFVAGYSPSLQCCSDIFVRAYKSSNGQILWTNVWDQGRDDLPLSIAASSTALVVVGYGGNTSIAPTSTPDFLVRAYDPATGTVLWDQRVDNGFAINDAATAVAIDGARVFVAGTTGPPDGRTDLLIDAYDLTSGALEWQNLRPDTGSPIVFFVEDDQLWASSSDYLLVFDDTTGRLVMQLP